MALSTLALVHNHLSIPTADTSQDAALTQFLGGASIAIRSHCQNYLYGALGPVAVSNPAAITCPQHGLESGQTILITGSTFAGLNAAQVVTVTAPDAFTVPINVTAADTQGTAVFCRQYTEYYDGNSSNELALKKTPVQSIVSLYEDDGGYYGDTPTSFEADTQLVEGTDFVLMRDDASESDMSRSGMVVKIDGTIWHRPTYKTQGLLTLTRGNPHGNIKVTYVAGYSRLLGDVALATNQLVAQLFNNASMGGPLGSETYQFYSYQRIAANLEASAMGSVKQLLKRYRKWVW